MSLLSADFFKWLSSSYYTIVAPDLVHHHFHHHHPHGNDNEDDNQLPDCSGSSAQVKRELNMAVPQEQS